MSMTNREWVQQDTDNAVIKMLSGSMCSFCVFEHVNTGIHCWEALGCREGILKWLEAEHIEGGEND